MATNICLVGIGKIAVDQHVPSINASGDWTLAATVSRAGTVEGVQAYTDFDAMLAERTDIPVISLCLPPVPRFDYAAKAIAAGRHVMLEGGRARQSLARRQDHRKRAHHLERRRAQMAPGSGLGF